MKAETKASRTAAPRSGETRQIPQKTIERDTRMIMIYGGGPREGGSKIRIEIINLARPHHPLPLPPPPPPVFPVNRPLFWTGTCD